MEPQKANKNNAEKAEDILKIKMLSSKKKHANNNNQEHNKYH